MMRFDHETTFQAICRTIGGWLLTERQIIVRSRGQIRFVPLSRIIQVGLGTVTVAVGGWFVYSTVSYFDLRDTVFTQETVLARSESAYRTLVEEMANSRDRISSLVKVLETTHSEVRDLEGESAALTTAIRPSGKGASSRTASLGGIASPTVRDKISERLLHLEGKAASVENQNREIEDSLEPGSGTAGAASEKHSSISDNTERLDVRVVKLARRLAQVRRSQNALLNRIAHSTEENIDHAENVIQLAGLDPSVMLQRIGASDHGQGGPFEPINTHDLRTESFYSGLKSLNGQIEHWQDLQKVLRQLPLAVPMDDYWVSGKFGRRRDPFNRRWANHRGLDLASKWHASVLAPAPGRVRIAGRWGKYGRFVEIDHGMGIRTRYGHLHKILVKRGQSVDFRQKIGEQGRTGRAKSAHLHYEILVNGRHVNPINFIKAGENVLKG